MIALLALALLSLATATPPKYGPPNTPHAQPLAQSHEYFRKAPAPDFWALSGHYVSQVTPGSCSLASVAMALNAARSKLPKKASERMILQTELAKQITLHRWKDRVGLGSKIAARGVTLALLRDLAEASFRAYGFPHASATLISATDLSEPTRKKIREILIQNETSDSDFILANFDQKAFTDDTSVGHISPVGAFDAQTDRVLIFDTDREWYEPYWVSFQQFMQGLHSRDSETKAFRGLIWIRTQP